MENSFDRSLSCLGVVFNRLLKLTRPALEFNLCRFQFVQKLSYSVGSLASSATQGLDDRAGALVRHTKLPHIVKNCSACLTLEILRLMMKSPVSDTVRPPYVHSSNYS